MKKNIFTNLNLKPVFKFKNPGNLNNCKETDPTTITVVTMTHIIWNANKSSAVY
ncbi:MAG: hypothetical protein JWR12_2644 [Mucilaginibacter sp.]|nr:hypothetical protein [Mucilaginibacter sp.]